MPIAAPCVHSNDPATEKPGSQDAIVLPFVRHPAGQPQASCAIEVFGRSAGILLADDGGGLLFLAADAAFWGLDQARFTCVAEAEKAVHVEWLRRQHRRSHGPGLRRRGH